MASRISRKSKSAIRTWRFESPAAMRSWARRLAPHIQRGDIIALIGTLGAGKTTLVQGIVGALGGDNEVNSPTFALVNEYRTPKVNVYHMDMYRLSTDELKRFPLEEYFNDGVCFIEWADRVRDRWPADVLAVQLKAPSREVRTLTLQPLRGTSWQKRLVSLTSR